MDAVTESPILVLQKNTCLRNIELMAEKAHRHKLIFRPHFKTHQSIEIGQWFKQFGVQKITVSSLRMAAYFANDGWNDITIAFPFNPHEADALNQLAANIAVNILIDNPNTLQQINQAIGNPVGVYIEITTGYKRSGVPNNSISKIDAIIEQLALNPNFVFKGFLTHAGHTYTAHNRNEILNIHFDSVLKMVNLKNQYIKRFPNIEISIGDTPGCTLSEYFNGIDEIRPGNFVFYDLMQHSLGVCHIDDIAVRMVCTVVSKQRQNNEMVIYGGAIHFSKDSITGADSKPLYGRIIIRNKNKEKILLDNTNYLCRLSQEHGVLKINSDYFDEIEIGDFVEVIPVHSCLTAHIMGEIYTTKGETIELMPRF